jgi:hypothetical protein
MAEWYVEAKPGEKWSHVSYHFFEWIRKNAPIQKFGCCEGDPIVVNGKTLFCFDFPDRYGREIERFQNWARTTDRLYGEERDGKVYFPLVPDLAHDLPRKVSVKPPWLR